MSISSLKEGSLTWRNLRSPLILFITSFICLLAIGYLQIPRLNNLIKQSQLGSVADLNREIEAERLRLNLIQRLPSFGLNNLISDWVFINFLQYFGDDAARQQTGYSLSSKYFEIIVERNPRFLDIYVPLSTSISLYAGQPEKSVALMDKGLQSMSPQIPFNSYYVWRYKGIDELLFLESRKAAQNSFQKAAEWASTYPDEESQNVALISRNIADFLAGNPDITSVQEAAWALVLVNAINSNDNRTRQLIIRRIQERGGNVTITPEGSVNVQLPKAY